MSDENVKDADGGTCFSRRCRDCGNIVKDGEEFVKRQMIEMGTPETVTICMDCVRKPDEETFKPRRPQPMSIPGTRRPGSSMPEEQALEQMRDTAEAIDAKIRERKCESCGARFPDDEIHSFKSPAGMLHYCDRCLL